jgi:cohesin complex subunit SA-1/2
MPEHKCLATNWSAMIKAIRFKNSSRGNENGRQEVARQRVLLRMLACGAMLEIGQGEGGVVEKSDACSVIGSMPIGSKQKRGRTDTNQPQEKLASILLKSLPGLLGAFNVDVVALRSITALPAYLIPSVFSLPSRKAEFQNVMKSLCATFSECTDERVLQNIARALSELVQGGHARVSEVKLQVKRLSISLQDRLMELLFRSEETKSRKSPRSSKGRSSRGSNASGSTLSSKGELSEATSPAVDIENSIFLCLLRIRVLTKKCSPAFLFDDEGEGDNQAEGFCNTITEGMSNHCSKRPLSFCINTFCFRRYLAIAKRLQDRKPILDEKDDQGGDDDVQTAASTRIPEIWTKEDPNIHAVVARSVDEALHILTLLTAWKLMDALNLHDDSDTVADVDMGVDEDDLVVLGMRNRLTRLLGFCFDHFLDKNEDEVSDEHLEFSATVQASAGRFACDLRVLFPRDWASAADPIRRKLALTDDAHLIGGFMRYLESRSEEVGLVDVTNPWA